MWKMQRIAVIIILIFEDKFIILVTTIADTGCSYSTLFSTLLPTRVSHTAAGFRSEVNVRYLYYNHSVQNSADSNNLCHLMPKMIWERFPWGQ